MHAQSTLRQDVPERLGLARGTRGYAHAIAGWVWFNKVQDAVFVGRLASGDGGPQQRRKFGLHGAEVCPRPGRNECSEVGHLSARKQRVNDLPIGGVPTENQETLDRASAHQGPHRTKQTRGGCWAAPRGVSVCWVRMHGEPCRQPAQWRRRERPNPASPRSANAPGAGTTTAAPAVSFHSTNLSVRTLALAPTSMRP